MRLSISLRATFFTSLLIFYSTVWAVDSSTKALEAYCVVVGAIAHASIRARDHEVPIKKVQNDLLGMEEFSFNPQLKKDVISVTTFVYNNASDESYEALMSFIVNDWCMVETEKVIKK